MSDSGSGPGGSLSDSLTGNLGRSNHEGGCSFEPWCPIIVQK